MNENQLSKRLNQVGAFVPTGSRLADIGSDHAYLPVSLMLQGKIKFAVAGEVVRGPYASAVKQVRKSGLENKIVVRLADGLDAVEEQDKIDAVSICGMGGVLIRDILERGWNAKRINGSELLILQPNIGERELRVWLQQRGYTILEEAILEENQKIYEIICAKREVRTVQYTEAELLFGPVLITKKGDAFRKKWQRELKQRQNVVEQLKRSAADQSEKIKKIESEIRKIEEVL
ncbi:tRNA (adenine-N(1))-methyltransferase [Enterococcus sp. BWB1-3]|uniref:tRNA (adenine(22)-N(1))-methyltransferase n=1 Tax=unclassified Enterococcus TaxID=2608891 RepID=UPI0019239CC8|nr:MULTISPECIES: tRNA (adenine(22)-N(1))-methyltransferase TrmK [unclassified Enterococcus]MBL1229452.1 tRNA (adenine-N(1))-methyltransferase [Enterococcus sp. BWB1-3]MCB5952624.1 tRNA (adenine(22)-N(1))-methyltransferase TrmK [Enterococcus sp. BWT-B8]MCB5956313.1 tRNA (adenine(22)-N(1))-methyltransferase TrmK [Enterococcus sp. CWB-B31]